LVPGYAQCYWGQRERGLVLAGSFATSLGVAVFAWGTASGLALLAFAFLTHVASAADALRQGAFPKPGWPETVSAVVGGLSVGLYAPLIAMAALVAWPVWTAEAGGYLVNRRAYVETNPVPGELVWYRPTPWSEPRLGRVVAKGGQAVEWSRDRLGGEGRELYGGSPIHSGVPPRHLDYQVPSGHLLVDPVGNPTNGRWPQGLLMVEESEVIGRVWARMYPIRDRGLL
jgi:hypothetical protein